MSVCLSVCEYVYVCSQPLSDSDKWGTIVPTLYMEIPGYYIWYAKKYHEYRYMSKFKVKVTKNMKLSDWAVTFEPDVVETSGWLHVVAYWKPHLHNILQNKLNNINVWHRLSTGPKYVNAKTVAWWVMLWLLDELMWFLVEYTTHSWHAMVYWRGTTRVSIKKGMHMLFLSTL